VQGNKEQGNARPQNRLHKSPNSLFRVSSEFCQLNQKRRTAN